MAGEKQAGCAVFCLLHDLFKPAVTDLVLRYSPRVEDLVPEGGLAAYAEDALEILGDDAGEVVLGEVGQLRRAGAADITRESYMAWRGSVRYC